MKTKLEIIQRLLDERHISAEEALVLMEKEEKIVYYPKEHPRWYGDPIPCSPFNPWPVHGTGSPQPTSWPTITCSFETVKEIGTRVKIRNGE